MPTNPSLSNLSSPLYKLHLINTSPNLNRYHSGLYPPPLDIYDNQDV